MKPREFWVKDCGDDFLEKVSERWSMNSGVIHLREVVPIDWNKVELDLQKRYHEKKDINSAADSWQAIKESVEKQLSGE